MTVTCWDRNAHQFQAASVIDCVQGGGSTIPPPPILQPQGPVAGTQQAVQQGAQTAQNVGSAFNDFTHSRFWTNLNSASFWKRVSLIGAGGILVLLGAGYILFAKPAERIAEHAI